MPSSKENQTDHIGIITLLSVNYRLGIMYVSFHFIFTKILQSIKYHFKDEELRLRKVK